MLKEGTSIQTLPSDLYGEKTVGTLVGIEGLTAKFSATDLVRSVPWLTAEGNYSLAFDIGAALALITIAIFYLLCPKIESLKPAT